MPNIAYNGQKENRLVKTKTTPRTNRIMASVPVIVPVKYRIANKIARAILIILSMVPIFFFIKTPLLFKK